MDEMTMLSLIPGIPGWSELLVIAFVGLLLFGRRLPEVGRSLGRSIVEFKKGINDVKDDVDRAALPKKSEHSALPPSEHPADAAHKTT
jgi:sec-independent protein translocase protein TatA